MIALRLYLIAAWAVLLSYAAYVLGQAGFDGATGQFFGPIAAGNWAGLANLDFIGFLAAAALWSGWRHGWNAAGWALALAVLVLGGLFLWGYVLVLLHRDKGDLKRVLLGVRADDAPHRRWTD